MWIEVKGTGIFSDAVGSYRRRRREAEWSHATEWEWLKTELERLVDEGDHD
jgi:hypothetical protein